MLVNTKKQTNKLAYERMLTGIRHHQMIALIMSSGDDVSSDDKIILASATFLR